MDNEIIHTVGFGKKRVGMTREACVKYHRENHAPFGRREAGPLGMIRYIGYYPFQAFSLNGEPIAELPWDFIVPESFTRHFFETINDWRTKTPGGIAITEDEAQFCDRSEGFMITCVENQIVPETDKDGVDIVFLGKKRADLTHEESIAYHRDRHAPHARRIYGSMLKKYTAYYVDASYNLETGKMPERPYDIIVIARFSKADWANMAEWSQRPEVRELIADENNFIDREATIGVLCDVTEYIS